MQQSLSELILRAIGSGSRNEFCRRAGISAGNLSRILRGQRPRPEVLAKIAAAGYGASYEQLMQAAGYLEKEGQEQSPGIPIYGSIAAGSPVEAFEDFSGYLRLDPYQQALGEDAFALRVVGDSMDLAGIPDGSLVVISRGARVEEGNICAVLVNGEATVKRVYQKGEYIVLVPVSRNPVYQPQIYSGEDDVRILGKVTLSIVDVQ